SAEEFPARLELEYRLRDRGFAEFGLREWTFVARQEGCDVLANSIESAREALAAVRRDGRQLPSAWARHASGLLATARWCHAGARALDSDEYQAREAFTALLGRLAELDDMLGETT